MPRSFISRDEATAADYIDDYPVRDERELLTTCKLYNLCRLILGAERSCIELDGETLEVGLECPLLKLLQSNVPDMDIAAEQHSEVFFLGDAARAVRSRFGIDLSVLKALMHSKEWHEVWLLHQRLRGISIGKTVRVPGPVILDVVNLDRTPHRLVFGFDAVLTSGLKEVSSRLLVGAPADIAKDGHWRADNPLRQEVGVGALQREHVLLRLPSSALALREYKIWMTVDGSTHKEYSPSFRIKSFSPSEPFRAPTGHPAGVSVTLRHLAFRSVFGRQRKDALCIINLGEARCMHRS